MEDFVLDASPTRTRDISLTVLFLHLTEFLVEMSSVYSPISKGKPQEKPILKSLIVLRCWLIYHEHLVSSFGTQPPLFSNYNICNYLDKRMNEKGVYFNDHSHGAHILISSLGCPCDRLRH